MAVTKGCPVLATAGVADNDSGIRCDTHSNGDIVVQKRHVVDICLNCPFDECLSKIRADKKEKKDAQSHATKF